MDPQQKNKVVGVNHQKIQDQKSEVVNYLWHLKKQGYSPATIETRVKILKQLIREGTNLSDPEDVKKAIASHDTWGNGHKQVVVHTYNLYAELHNIQWNPPYYRNVKSLPFVPLEREINDLISGTTPKISTALLLLKETGMRIGEAWNLRWTDIDTEKNTMRCRTEKHGNPRQFKISNKLMMMLERLPKRNQYIFGKTNLKNHRSRFERQRRALANKLQNPRLLQIKFHTFRHFYATKLYRQTKSLVLVKNKLGHRNINSTMVYISLVETNEENQNYHQAIARNEKEAGKLIEEGWSYVCTTPQEIMMFRRRK